MPLSTRICCSTIWGKPVFTLLAAPFAYWGFTGIKLFNVALATATLWLTYRSACLLNIPVGLGGDITAGMLELVVRLVSGVITASAILNKNILGEMVRKKRK